MRIRTVIHSLPLAVLAVLLLVCAAQGREWEREIRLEPGKTIVLECDDGGSAVIEGWDRDVVKIAWFDRMGDEDDFEVDVRETEDGLEILSEMGRRRRQSNALRFELMVPRMIDIEFESDGGGLELIGLEGTFSGRTAGGGFSIEGCKGLARLRSGGGEIEIVDSELDGSVRTGGGRVLVKNVTGEVEASSGGGIIRYENVRGRDGKLRAPDDACPREALVEGAVLLATAGGGIDVDEAPHGACVRTGGGDIDIRDADRFVLARTGGGDIEIETRSGAVEASTGAGEIEVSVERDDGERDTDVECFTGLGDVTLVVPQGFSMELDLEIAYTPNSRRDYRIITDLDIDVEETDDWDYGSTSIEGVDPDSREGRRLMERYGSPKRYITGTGSLAGGRHRVTVRTTNGDISIRER